MGIKFNSFLFFLLIYCRKFFFSLAFLLGKTILDQNRNQGWPWRWKANVKSGKYKTFYILTKEKFFLLIFIFAISPS